MKNNFYFVKRISTIVRALANEKSLGTTDRFCKRGKVLIQLKKFNIWTDVNQIQKGKPTFSRRKAGLFIV
ncbi:hypothetical protein CX649_07390 [Bacillaceae bacterium ZC4]|nr:hypothetical protein CX649_07390 [Bacillaceae bacterium ZC4]